MYVLHFNINKLLSNFLLLKHLSLDFIKKRNKCNDLLIYIQCQLNNNPKVLTTF